MERASMAISGDVGPNLSSRTPAPGVRSSLRHSGADSTFSPVLWSVSEFKQRLDSSIEASHRAWEGNLIRRPCDQLHLPHQCFGSRVPADSVRGESALRTLSRPDAHDASPKKIIRLRHSDFRERMKRSR